MALPRCSPGNTWAVPREKLPFPAPLSRLLRQKAETHSPPSQQLLPEAKGSPGWHSPPPPESAQLGALSPGTPGAHLRSWLGKEPSWRPEEPAGGDKELSLLCANPQTLHCAGSAELTQLQWRCLHRPSAQHTPPSPALPPLQVMLPENTTALPPLQVMLHNCPASSAGDASRKHNILKDTAAASTPAQWERGRVWIWGGFFGIMAVTASITHKGEKWSQVRGGRAAAAGLAEPWGEESSIFPAAGACAKNDVCDKKRWNKGGGTAFSSMGKEISPSAQKIRGGVFPQPCQRQSLSWFGHLPSTDFFCFQV